MIDPSRILEIERRLTRADQSLREIQRKASMASDAAVMSSYGTSPPGSGSTGGGGGVPTAFRWEYDLCFRVIYTRLPEFQAASSLNVTLDEEAFDEAVAFMQEGHPSVGALNYDNTVFFSENGNEWTFYKCYGSENFTGSHVVSWAWAVQVGTAAKSVPIDDGSPGNILVKYALGIQRKLDGAPYDAVSPSYGETYDPPTPEAYPFADTNLSKSVTFKQYNADGSLRGYGTLVATRPVHVQPEDTWFINEPYLFTIGPKHGTTGAYQLRASCLQTLPGGGTTGGGTGGYGDIYMSWGATDCDTYITPVGSDEEEPDWGPLCAEITSASSTWTKIPGLTVKMNGTTITSTTLGSYSSPPTVRFEFSDSLREYMERNGDVSIVCTWSRRCDPPPFNPQYGSAAVWDGTELVVTRNTSCPAKDTEVLLDITMSASPSRNLFDDECCTPYATHCSVTSISSDQVNYYISP